MSCRTSHSSKIPSGEKTAAEKSMDWPLWGSLRYWHHVCKCEVGGLGCLYENPRSASRTSPTRFQTFPQRQSVGTRLWSWSIITITWGATYSAMLYSFLQSWPALSQPLRNQSLVCNGWSYNQLPIATGLATPVVLKNKRLFQSPSVQLQLPHHGSLGEETNAFARAVRA